MSLEDLSKQIQDIKAQAQKTGKDLISKAAKVLFKKYPELQAIYWTQYTPYFMDGDECVFSVNSIMGYAGELPKDDEGETIDLNEVFSEEYHNLGEYIYPEEKAYKNPALVADFDDFVSAIKAAEDVMRDAIGDHCSVLITRDGITVEEYEHD